MINNLKNLIRSSIVVLSFIYIGIGALVLRFIVFPIQGLLIKDEKSKKLKYSETLQNTWKSFVHMLQILKIIRIETKDMEKLKNIKNSIIVSTHPSFIDIVILISIIPYTTCFAAKKLDKNPFFKGMVRLLFIIEGEPTDKWVNDARNMLNDGFNVIIFPMGTRHRKDEFPKIRRGAALLAQQSGKNIVMIDMQTDFDFLQNGQPFYEAGNQAVVYTISDLGIINTQDFLDKYPNDVDFKTIITKHITKTLYKDKNELL